MKCPNCRQEANETICSCGYCFDLDKPEQKKQSWISKAISEASEKTKRDRQAYEVWDRTRRSGAPTVSGQSLTAEELEEQRKAMHLQMQSQQLELQRRQLELQEIELKSAARCPKCGSTSLSGHKKGFGVGKAVIGAAAGTFIAGPLGLLGLTAGNIGSKKVRVTCMRCGRQFWA